MNIRNIVLDSRKYEDVDDAAVFILKVRYLLGYLNAERSLENGYHKEKERGWAPLYGHKGLLKHRNSLFQHERAIVWAVPWALDHRIQSISRREVHWKYNESSVANDAQHQCYLCFDGIFGQDLEAALRDVRRLAQGTEERACISRRWSA